MSATRQTESVSLRLDKNTWNKLKKSANKQKMSPNALVSQILDSHIEWEMDAVAAGWATMPKLFLIELFKMIDKVQMEKIIARLSIRMAKDINLYMRGKHDLDSWLSIMKARSERSGFNWTEYDDSEMLEIVMQHDMGENWSIYFKTFYENVLHDLGVKTEFDYTDNTLVMKVYKTTNSSWRS